MRIELILYIFAGYIGAHLLVYALLRHTATLRSEKGILLYHVVSALVATGLLLGWAWHASSEAVWSALVAAIALHGIYSLSFLEAWSLAEGSYSLSVLSAVARAELSGGQPDFLKLEQIGENKQADRIAALEKLALVVKHEGSYQLSSRGKNFARVLRGLRCWVDPKAER